MRARTYALMLSLLVAAGCDKSAEQKPPAPPATTGEPSVEELVGKLPKAQPSRGPAPAAEAPQVQVVGKFGGNASLPTPDGKPKPFQVEPKAVDELNIVGPPRIQSAFLERTLGPDASVIVHLGGAENDGLMVTVRHEGKSASRPIPPANNGPELVSNLDHTLDRVLDELGIPRR